MTLARGTLRFQLALDGRLLVWQEGRSEWAGWELTPEDQRWLAGVLAQVAKGGTMQCPFCGAETDDYEHTCLADCLRALAARVAQLEAAQATSYPEAGEVLALATTEAVSYVATPV